MHCFYGIFDPFSPKISEKFTEKIPTFGEGGGGSSRLGQNPNFYQIFFKAPLLSHRQLQLMNLFDRYQSWLGIV